MAKPKKKKHLKLNKKPKNKTVSNMKDFLKKRLEIERENKKRDSEYSKAVKEWDSLKTKVSNA